MIPRHGDISVGPVEPERLILSDDRMDRLPEPQVHVQRLVAKNVDEDASTDLDGEASKVQTRVRASRFEITLHGPRLRGLWDYGGFAHKLAVGSPFEIAVVHISFEEDEESSDLYNGEDDKQASDKGDQENGDRQPRKAIAVETDATPCRPLILDQLPALGDDFDVGAQRHSFRGTSPRVRCT